MGTRKAIANSEDPVIHGHSARTLLTVGTHEKRRLPVT